MVQWMYGWLSVCVGCLLVGDLLGLWRGVKPRKPIGRGLWRGLISRKPKILLTINQHTHSPNHASDGYPTIRQYTHPHIHSPPFIHPPFHSSTHPFLDG